MNNNYNDIAMSYQKFLSRYYGVNDKKLLAKKFNHSELKETFPYLNTTSFKKLKLNSELVYTGNVIIVKDSYGHLAPYIAPVLDLSTDFEEEICSIDDDNIEKAITEVIEYENLGLYELSCLAKQYKKEKRTKELRIVSNLIKKKRDPKVKVYKMEKENLHKKGIEDDEKY